MYIIIYVKTLKNNVKNRVKKLRFYIYDFKIYNSN